MAAKFLSLILAIMIGDSCSSRKPFWTYVVEDDVGKPLPKREGGAKDDPKPISPHNIRVAYNDGGTLTEVWIPVLTSGQQIIIDHKSQGAPSSLALVPIPPAQADKTVEEAYVKSGQPIVQSKGMKKSELWLKKVITSWRSSIVIKFWRVTLTMLKPSKQKVLCC